MFPTSRAACCRAWRLAALLWILATAIIAGVAAAQRRTQLRARPPATSGEATSTFRCGRVLVTLGLLLLIVVPLVVLSGRYHVLGTDKVGQDVLYLTLKSIRTGLVIGTLTTLVMLPFALALGIMAGYFQGWVDDVIQYLYTTLSSIPGVLLIAAAVLMMQVYMDTHPEIFDSVTRRADVRLLFLCMILGVTSWTGLCRLLRGETLKLRELEYVQAAHAFGVSDWRIMTRHILPNVMHIVMIAMVMDFSGLVLAEAVLSYVGRRRRSGDEQLRHHDQRRAAGAGARADGVVVAGRRLRVHVRAGAVGQPVRRRGARRVRSAHAHAVHATGALAVQGTARRPKGAAS